MKINFDYYRNLEKVDLFLCNPDGRELFVVPGRNRRIHLRFNDLSELTFDVDAVTTLSDHKIINLEAYDYIQTKRLIYATGIGWFQIEHVDEYDDGVTKYKTVTAESGQAIFKNKGFISEERVYCFYNPADPKDDFYDSSDDSAIPSVMGQWSKQLGIKQALGQGRAEPSEAFEDWTVTYIDPGLVYQGETGVCRTFDENVTYGYDWIANTVSSAFEVVVLFDFLYKTIHVLRPDEATQKTNVIYTFNNFIRQVNVTENAEDIVTVLNCNGNNCDITAVNPTGTNYICDFSYFMDTIHYRWMSEALIKKLNQWKKACDAAKESYSNTVQKLRSAYLGLSSCETSLKDASLHLQDLRNAQSKRYTVGDGEPGVLCGTVCVETVEVGQFSLDLTSLFDDNTFSGGQILTAYKISPTYDEHDRKWIFSGTSKNDTADNIVCANLSDSNITGDTYWYFSDARDESNSSYCRLKVSTKMDSNGNLTHYCSGFERYIAYTYPCINPDTGATEYTDNMQMWINIRESNVNVLSFQKQTALDNINRYNNDLHAMASSLNIVSYFSNTPELLRELNCYWIEGDYTNDNIAVLDTTTPAEEIDLANELMSAGYTELRKMCQPRFSFSLDAIDATKIPEFASQVRMLELGKIVTIEKDEGLWYYPALLSIEMDLDHTDDFRMEFANALRLDDWGYTYADLIASAASTSRKISANWQDLSSYAKDKDTISSLIQDPLDATLRASFANMVNQEFVIDKTGILGRKFVNEGESIFEQEQVRLINNLLIFTDDGWQTAKTALGKIYYTDENGNNVTSYGLIAETLIGSVIIGETVKVRNENNSVLINKDGITIKRLVGKGTTPIIAEHEFTFNSSAQISLSETLNIVEGETYVVVWDGLEYICECKSGAYESYPILYVGNEVVIGKENDGIPFFLGRIDVSGGISLIACLEPNTTHTAALYPYVAEEVTVFQATTEGTLKISNYVSGSTFSDYQMDVSNSFTTHWNQIKALGSQLDIAKTSINAKVSAEYLNEEQSFGWELGHDKFIVYSESSSGSGEEILLAEQNVDAGYLFIVSCPLDVGQQYFVRCNGKKYLCEAKYIIDTDFQGSVALGNTKDFDDNDTGEPFCIRSASGGLIVTLLENGSSGTEQLMPAQWVNTNEFFSTNVQLTVGELYNVQYNETNYSCVAKHHDLYPSWIFLGNLKKVFPTEDVLDTGEPFCVIYDPDTREIGVWCEVAFIPLFGISISGNGNATTVLLGISIPGSGYESKKQVLTVDKSGLQVEGTIYATSGTLEDLYINGKLYFNGETPGAYYIDGSAMSSPGDDAAQLMPEQWVNANVYFSTYVQLVVGQVYDVQYNGTKYSCVAKQDDQYPSLIFLGNLNIVFPAVDTGEPFCVIYDPLQSQMRVCCSEESVYFGISSKQYYINMPGFKVSTKTAYFSGELIAASGTFSGELKAASGTFSGRLQAGTAQHPFIISGGRNVTDSPCIYSIEKQYAGSGGYGSVADNRVYIGGDGFSYWLYEPQNGNDYATSIRPGIVFCSGDANRSGTQFTAIAYKHDSITFTYGGDTNPREMTKAYNDYVAKMSINSDHVYVDGKFNVSQKSYVFVNGIFSFSSGTSITSDRNKKHDIMQMDDRYGILFDSLLPITYKYNDGQSGRTHTGFIAQDVMSAISVAGLTTADFAAYVETPNLDGDTVRSLRYEEFVSLNTWQIQKLKARVAELERIVATLQGV